MTEEPYGSVHRMREYYRKKGDQSNTTDFKNLTRAEEAALVPDWVVVLESDKGAEVLWSIRVGDDTDDVIHFTDPVLVVVAHGRILRDILPALQFFAANDRLPRLDDGGEVR